MSDLELKSIPTSPRWDLLDEDHLPLKHFHRTVTSSRRWRPPTDVFETEDAIIVRVEIAGMRDADFSVSLQDRLLVIQGTRSDQSERQAFHQMEIRFGEFSTEVELHWPVISDEVEAVYRDGFLTLVLPKAKPRVIEIG